MAKRSKANRKKATGKQHLKVQLSNSNDDHGIDDETDATTGHSTSQVDGGIDSKQSPGQQPKPRNAEKPKKADQPQSREAENPQSNEAEKSQSKRTHSLDGETPPKRKYRDSRRVIFALGALLGLILTVIYLAYSHPNFDFESLVNSKSFFDDWSDWKDLLPGSVNQFISDYADSSKGNFQNGAESFSVGRRMLEKYNLSASSHVILVPGVISTGIESWGTLTSGECPSINHFRKRLWGSFYMLRTMVLDKACWLRHIMLDETTGLDPPGIKLRAAQGFEAADFFVAGYWIWNKILQNLAVIGYEPDNMVSALYDWRLAYLDLERRDKYFTKLKAQIEATRHSSGRKSILVGHSMGSQVIFYFLKWVEAEGKDYGNGGPHWCNEHIESFIDISGSLLGTPKALPAIISGEMKDTVNLNALAIYGLEKFFSRKERADMLRSFGGIASMFPKGGDTIWGNLTHAPDDPTNTLEVNDTNVEISGSKSDTFGTFIRFKKTARNDSDVEKFTVKQSLDKMLKDAPEWYEKRVKDQYSYGLARTAKELKKNNHDHSKWSNPLEAALPNAPDMKIYSFYGVGKPTERAYTYTNPEAGVGLEMVIDTELENPVFLGDGDGTISILTHSIIHEWKKGRASRFNPGGIPVTIVEMKDELDRYDIRGGAKTADHVDILGSAEMNELVLLAVGGMGHEIKDRIVSNLHEIVLRMDL